MGEKRPEFQRQGDLPDDFIGQSFFFSVVEGKPYMA